MKHTKIAILAAAAAAAWIANWLFLKQILFYPDIVAFVSWVSLAIIFGITFTTFLFLVNPDKVSNAIFIVLVLGSYILIMPKNEFVLLGGAWFTLMLFLFEHRIRIEEKSRQNFSIRQVSSASISVIIYGLLLLIGFNTYYNVQTDFNSRPEAYYGKLDKAANKAVPYVARGFTQLTDEQRAELTAVVTKQSTDKVKSAVDQHREYVPFIFALIVTALLWSFGFLIRWTAVLVTWMVFEIFVHAKFFHLRKVPIEVEKLEI